MEWRFSMTDQVKMIGQAVAPRNDGNERQRGGLERSRLGETPCGLAIRRLGQYPTHVW